MSCQEWECILAFRTQRDYEFPPPPLFFLAGLELTEICLLGLKANTTTLRPKKQIKKKKTKTLYFVIFIFNYFEVLGIQPRAYVR